MNESNHNDAARNAYEGQHRSKRTHILSILQHLKAISKLTSSNAASSLIIAGGAIILSRLVSPTEFGHYAFLVQIAMAMYPLLTFRYEHALPLIARNRLARETMLIAVLLTSVTLTLLLLVAGIGLSVSVPPDSGSEVSLLHHGPLIVLTAFSLSTVSSLQSAAIAQANLNRIATARVIRASAVVSLQLLLVLTLGPEAIWLVISELLGNLLQAALLTNVPKLAIIRIVSQGGQRAFARRGFALARRHKVFPLVTLPHMLTHNLLGLAHASLLGAFFGLEALGCFFLMRRLIFGTMSLIGTAVYQHALSEAAQSGQTQLYAITLRACQIVAGVSAIAGVCVLLLGQWLFTVAAGPEWELSGKMAVATIPLIIMEPTVSTLAFVPVFLKRQLIAFAAAVVQGLAGISMIVLAGLLSLDVLSAILISSLSTSVVMACFVVWTLVNAKRAHEGKLP